MICKDCPHKQVLRSGNNATHSVFCNHPNQQYINKYFKEHGIHKMQGFLGFINSRGDFQIKKSPAWCPLKQKEQNERKVKK